MAGQQTQDRRWEVNLEADELGQPDDRRFAEDVQGAMLEGAAILLRLGGAIQSYAVRQQDEQTGLWYPVKIVFKWQSFVPGVRAPRPVQEPPAPATPEQATAAMQESVAHVAAEAAVPGPLEPVEDGMEMVDQAGNVVVVGFDQVQAALRDGWVPAAEMEDEDTGADA